MEVALSITPAGVTPNTRRRRSLARGWTTGSLIALIVATVLSVRSSADAFAATVLHKCMLAAKEGEASKSTAIAQRAFVQFMSCVSSHQQDADGGPCNTFTATALESLYPHLHLQREGGTWMTTHELVERITHDTATWTLLGTAGDQAVLNKAQAHVKRNRAVVALSQDSLGNNHAVIILAGPLIRSPKWHGLTAPNSASFAHRSPHRSYVGCPLSYGFRHPEDVAIYTER